MDETTLKGKMMNATKWATITELAAKLVSPVINMVLARLLAPEAFGVVASITMIVTFADMFTDAGFQKYLVQREFRSNEEKYRFADVAFWTNFGISLCLWGIITLLREPIATMVGNPGLGTVIAISCIQLPLTSFSSIQMALYRRDFDFRTLFFVRIVSVFIPLVVSIPLAILGFSYWALIIGAICSQLSNAIVVMIKSKWKPKLFYRLSVLKKMFSFSSWSLIEAIFIWFTAWVDALIIGAALSSYYLGLYKTSTTMVNVVLALITSATTPVLFSALSRMQDNNEQFKQVFLQMQRVVSIFVFPLGVGVYLYSDLATLILLGNQWIEASEVIGQWALTSAITIIFGHYCSEVYRAKGRPKLSILAQFLHLIILIPVCMISVKYGFWVLVFARSWIRMQLILVHFIIMRFKMRFPIAAMLRNVLPSASSALAMGLTGYVLRQINSGLAWSFVSIGICISVYFGGLFLFPSARKEVVSALARLIRGKRSQRYLVKEI